MLSLLAANLHFLEATFASCGGNLLLMKIGPQWHQSVDEPSDELACFASCGLASQEFSDIDFSRLYDRPEHSGHLQWDSAIHMSGCKTVAVKDPFPVRVSSIPQLEKIWKRWQNVQPRHFWSLWRFTMFLLPGVLEHTYCELYCLSPQWIGRRQLLNFAAQMPQSLFHLHHEHVQLLS